MHFTSGPTKRGKYRNSLMMHSGAADKAFTGQNE